MSGSADHPGTPPGTGEQRTIGGFLAAALSMEDQISQGVYEDYLDRANWPARLPEEAFLRIRKHLVVLIEDTKRHAKIIQALIDEHAKTE